jgi:hypothetical protein
MLWRDAVAASTADKSLTETAVDLLKKVTALRIGPNEKSAVPDEDEVAKVFAAILRTT